MDKSAMKKRKFSTRRHHEGVRPEYPFTPCGQTQGSMWLFFLRLKVKPPLPPSSVLLHNISLNGIIFYMSGLTAVSTSFSSILAAPLGAEKPVSTPPPPQAVRKLKKSQHRHQI
jgi:hypothetical protein